MKATKLLSALAASLALAASAQAQTGFCDIAGSLETMPGVVCVTPSGSYSCDINVPWGPGFIAFTQGFTYCCGQEQTTFWWGGGCLWVAGAYSDPSTPRAAAQAESETGEQFLVADCQGNLVPFDPAPLEAFATKVARSDRVELR